MKLIRLTDEQHGHLVKKITDDVKRYAEIRTPNSAKRAQALLDALQNAEESNDCMHLYADGHVCGLPQQRAEHGFATQGDIRKIHDFNAEEAKE